jgi:hypothetical protein
MTMQIDQSSAEKLGQLKVFKTSQIKKADDMLKSVMDRISREKFEHQYLPLPQD